MACPNSSLNSVSIPIDALTVIQDAAVTENLVSDVTVPAPLVCMDSTNTLIVNGENGTVIEEEQPVQSSSVVASSSGGLRIAKDLLSTSIKEDNSPQQNGNSSLNDDAIPTVGETALKPVSAAQATTAKPPSKKGPPPGLLPLPSTPEGRTPRQAALRSAERIKVMAREDESNEDQENDIQILEESTNQASGKALLKIQPLNTNVIVRIIDDPDMEFCKVCKKIACCAFKSKNEKNDLVNAFCSKQCVLQFYPRQDIKFLKNNNEVVTDLPDLDGTLQNIVIEPDIEIQTLSDDFQMDDGEEIIETTVNGGLTGCTSDEGVIEMAAKETFCCYSCKASLYHRKDALNWEAMEFCSDKCLKTYMKVIGSHCNMCNQQVSDNYLGKLCVRFGTVIRQFCSSDCLDKFKGSNKLCGQCQVNMPEKDKVYCSQACDDLARRLNNKSEFFGRRSCSVCSAVRPIQDEIFLNGQSHWLCSRPCRNAFCFVNKITSLDCGVCGRLFDAKATPRFALRDYSKSTATIAATWFCSNSCFSTHLLKLRKIECCARCQVKKYNVDMITRKSTMSAGVGNVPTELELIVHFCSTHCYASTLNPPKEDQRALRKKTGEVGAPPVLKPIAPAPPPSRQMVSKQVITAPTVMVPRSVVAAMNLGNGSNTNGVRPTGPNFLQTPLTKVASPVTTGIQAITNAMLPIELQHKVVFVPAKPKIMKNKSVWCQPSNFSQQTNESTQTTQMIEPNSFELEQDNQMESITFENQMEVDNQSELSSSSTVELEKKSDTDPVEVETIKNLESTSSSSQTEPNRPFYVPVMIPIPVPIYVPIPMAMYSCPAPFPLAFPIPLPIPTPVAYPIDPELMEKFMKAIAESKKDKELVLAETTDSVPADTETNVQEAEPNPTSSTNAIAVSSSPPPNESVSSVFKDEVDFEADLPSYIIRVPVSSSRKRSNSTSHSPPSAKRIREADYSRSDGEEPAEGRGAPSALDLKGAFRKDLGSLIWSKWMQKKKKNSTSYPRLSDMGVMEVSSNLISFVRELRKPDGASYRPDVLLYFIYGLQLTFAADQRRENLLMEASLLPFQQELDKQLFPFYDTLMKSINADDISSVSTCLKESHLWECRQLGCDSPIVLVFTMLYFNTKYFRLYTAEQHQQISFNTINKQSKKIFNSGGSPASNRSSSSSKAVYSLQLLHTVQQQTDLAAMNMKIKKPMETPQNTDRPTECPIKHYNFYLTKCPESVRSRKDAFYMVPEVSCTPDSPFWYSSQPLPHWMLARMLRRVILIEEVLRSLCLSD